MSRKRVTQIFPFLLPVRVAQKKACFYLKMKLDKERYASEQRDEKLPYLLFTSRCQMRNANTGFPMCYQENKIHNLKIASKLIDGLIIRPGESFSFYNRVRNADKAEPYKEALVEVDRKLTTEYGGGLCQISNLLCRVFLNSPLTVTERHGHLKKDFPEPASDAPMVVDVNVVEGWKDLKVKNNTGDIFQICLSFDDDAIIGTLYTHEATI